MAVAPAAVVEGPSRSPLPFGLFSVLAFRPDTAGRWLNGVAWETGTCAPARGIADPDCDPGTPTEGLPKDLTFEQDIVGATPFTVYGAYSCSVGSVAPERAAELARAHLLAREEARVEQALWEGDLDNVPNLVAAVTGAGAGATVTGATIEEAWAALEGRLGEEYGSLGVIHAPRALALVALAKGVLETTGGRLRTKLGTPVVAGAGYPDEGRIIGTGAMFGYRSEVFAPAPAGGYVIDHRQNDLLAIAERTYVVGFDPCGIGAATIP